MNLARTGTKQATKMQARAQTTAHRGIANAKVAATRAGAKARVASVKARARAQASDAPDSKKAIGAAGALGAVGAFFLDPEQGSRRRHATRDRIVGAARNASARMRRRAEESQPVVHGKVEPVNGKVEPAQTPTPVGS